MRSSSFFASLGIHSIVVVFLGLVPSSQKLPERPILEELIQPEKHKIVYYDFRKKKLPDVNSRNRIGRTPDPRGEEVSKQTVIAASPQAKSKEQFIWQPAPKIEIRRDLAAPNLVARLNSSLPALPAPPQEKRQPEVEGVKASQPDPAPKQPDGDVNHAPESTAAARAPKQPKAFVPPPPVERPKLPIQTPVLDAAAPAITSPFTESRLPAGAGMPVLATAAAPPPTAPPGPVASAGNARADIAIASLHPSETANNELPDGERPGRFSKAPTSGPVSTGAVNGSAALTVPNLTIREDKSKPAKAPDEVLPPIKTILYAETVRSIPVSTLSVPLRPASRSIPRSVDARFQGRNVYTMVVPIENLPAYAGDWIVWFAERDVKPGDTPVVRAPVPFRKLEPIGQAVSVNRTGQRVQLAGTLEKDGKLRGISLLTAAGPAIEFAVIQDISSWEFKPATRNGIPVDVEIVIEIPFNLPPALAQRSQP
jgi:hypothetical protein